MITRLKHGLNGWRINIHYKVYSITCEFLVHLNEDQHSLFMHTFMPILMTGAINSLHTVYTQCLFIYNLCTLKCHMKHLMIYLFTSIMNSTVISISVYQAGDPGLHPPRSACHRNVEFYHCGIDSLQPVPMTGSKKVVHVLVCLCNNACKRSLAICCKSRALCPVSRLLSLYDLHALNRDVNMIQSINQCICL